MSATCVNIKAFVRSSITAKLSANFSQIFSPDICVYEHRLFFEFALHLRLSRSATWFILRVCVCNPNAFCKQIKISFEKNPSISMVCLLRNTLYLLQRDKHDTI